MSCMSCVCCRPTYSGRLSILSVYVGAPAGVTRCTLKVSAFYSTARTMCVGSGTFKDGYSQGGRATEVRPHKRRVVLPDSMQCCNKIVISVYTFIYCCAAVLQCCTRMRCHVLAFNEGSPKSFKMMNASSPFFLFLFGDDKLGEKIYCCICSSAIVVRSCGVVWCRVACIFAYKYVCVYGVYINLLLVLLSLP